MRDHGRPDIRLIEAQRPLIMALRQLEQCLMPGEVDVVGRTRVKALEPALEKLPAVHCVAGLEEHMGNRVGSDGIGRT